MRLVLCHGCVDRLIDGFDSFVEVIEVFDLFDVVLKVLVIGISEGFDSLCGRRFQEAVNVHEMWLFLGDIGFVAGKKGVFVLGVMAEGGFGRGLDARNRGRGRRFLYLVCFALTCFELVCFREDGGGVCGRYDVGKDGGGEFGLGGTCDLGLRRAGCEWCRGGLVFCEDRRGELRFARRGETPASRRGEASGRSCFARCGARARVALKALMECQCFLSRFVYRGERELGRGEHLLFVVVYGKGVLDLPG